MNELAWMYINSTWESVVITLILLTIISMILLSPVFLFAHKKNLESIGGVYVTNGAFAFFLFTMVLCGGLMIGAGMKLYMMSNYAPANWLTPLPVQESVYIKNRLRNQNEPLTMYQFVSLKWNFDDSLQERMEEYKRRIRQLQRNEIKNQQLNGTYQ